MAEGIDVVYVLRPGDENEELRYSLRSLSRLLGRHQVIFTGSKPVWAKPDAFLPVRNSGNKYRSAEANLAAAIDSAAVSDPFYLFNDDFFLVKKYRRIPTLHRGLLRDVIAKYGMKSGIYAAGMRKALDQLTAMGVVDPLSYEMHSPLLVDKEGMDTALAMRNGVNCFHLRTIYGNTQNIGGDQSEDVKVYRNTTGYEQWPMLSTTDLGFRYRDVGKYLRSLYPTRSEYER